MSDAPSPDEPWPPGYALGAPVLAYGTLTVRRARRGELRVLVKTAESGSRNWKTTAIALERERRIIADIDHPALPPLIDVAREGSRMALIFLDHGGHRLDLVCERLGRLSVDAALAVGIEVAGALSAIHRAGHAHGLLRPELVELSDSGHVYLHAAGQLPRGVERGQDEILELPRHMAPETILGDEPDASSDVFLFGMLLFQCLAGDHPFSGDEAGISQRIRHAPAPSLRQLVAEVPAELDRIVRRCLQKRPRDRHPDMASLQALLVAALRARTSLPREVLVSRALASAGIADELSAPRERHLEPLVAAPRRSFKRGAAVGAAALLVATMGFAGLRACDAEERAAGSDPRGIVGKPALLRVLAHPWAEIHIDGVLVDVTPVGRPIALSPGQHEVVFKHPQAPDERRVVEIVPGQTIVLDVAMRVERPEPARSADDEVASDDASP